MSITTAGVFLIIMIVLLGANLFTGLLGRKRARKRAEEEEEKEEKANEKRS